MWMNESKDPFAITAWWMNVSKDPFAVYVTREQIIILDYK
jgi:hypothetical protein